MDFIKQEIIKRVPNCDLGYLEKYIEIVSKEPPIDKNVYVEKHHILPKALWKNYSNLNANKFNLSVLTVNDHLLAHLYFSLCTNLLWNAIPSICYWDPQNMGNRKAKTEEEIKTIASVIEVYKKNCRGENHPNHGRKHTDETKRKISKSRLELKIKWSEDQKENWSKTLLALKIKRSDEWKKAQSERMMGYKWTDESRKKISAIHKGKTISKEHRQAITDKRTGIKTGPMSEEQKKLLSELRTGEKNPMFGKKRTDEWKKENSDRMKKLKRIDPIWNELYEPLYILWVESKTTSGYTFSKWLERNSEYRFGDSKLKSLVKDFQNRNSSL